MGVPKRQIINSQPKIVDHKAMLRSINNLVGFTLGATDGEIGRVYSFLFDCGTWAVRYLVVDTGRWLPGRKVLISPKALDQPDWQDRIFRVHLTKEQIRDSPDIDTDKPVSRQREIELHQHYGWTPYWGLIHGLEVAPAPPSGDPEQSERPPSWSSRQKNRAFEARGKFGAIESMRRTVRSAISRISSSAMTTGSFATWWWTRESGGSGGVF